MTKTKNASRRRPGTHKEQIFALIQQHPEGIDDDDISDLSGVRLRQQVQQLCNQLAAVDRIHRTSVSKAGKRRKIHNFPIVAKQGLLDRVGRSDASWRRRLANLVAATGKAEDDLLEEALQALAMKILREAEAGA